MSFGRAECPPCSLCEEHLERKSKTNPCWQRNTNRRSSRYRSWTLGRLWRDCAENIRRHRDFAILVWERRYRYIGTGVSGCLFLVTIACITGTHLVLESKFRTCPAVLVLWRKGPAPRILSLVPSFHIGSRGKPSREAAPAVLVPEMVGGQPPYGAAAKGWPVLEVKNPGSCQLSLLNRVEYAVEMNRLPS